MKKIYEIPTSELIYVASSDIITNSQLGEDMADDPDFAETANVD